MSLAGDLGPLVLAIAAGGGGFLLAKRAGRSTVVAANGVAGHSRGSDRRGMGAEEKAQTQAEETEAKAAIVAELESRVEELRRQIQAGEDDYRARRAAMQSELDERVRQAEDRINQMQRTGIEQTKAAATDAALRATAEVTAKSMALMIQQFLAESLKGREQAAVEAPALEAEGGAAAGE